MSSAVESEQKYWKGYSSLRNLVVFGASYCEVGYTYYHPHPSKERPLGIDFPGKTWSEPGTPNWVGYITQDHSPSGEFATDPLLVYDYGIGGQTAFGVKEQVEEYFLPYAGRKPDWAPWTAEDTLFIIWVGINDCGFNLDPQAAMRILFEAQEMLYESGARNFLFINVPPMQRSPLGPVSASRKRNGDPFENWNAELQKSALEFEKSHPDVAVFHFSSWDLFTAVLDDPVKYGFKEEDRSKNGGGIWVDRLHPTTKMHKIIADRIVEYLKSVNLGKTE